MMGVERQDKSSMASGVMRPHQLGIGHLGKTHDPEMPVKHAPDISAHIWRVSLNSGSRFRARIPNDSLHVGRGVQGALVEQQFECLARYQRPLSLRKFGVRIPDARSGGFSAREDPARPALERVVEGAEWAMANQPLRQRIEAIGDEIFLEARWPTVHTPLLLEAVYPRNPMPGG